MTDQEKITNYETMTHIQNVQRLLVSAAQGLLHRGLDHDASKLEDPELATFVEFTPKLKGLTYGSPEYKACTAAMGPALQHHYASNRHHPEHHEHGVSGMTLIDLLEMFCDWKAATMRHDDGDIFKSIKINAKRFGMPQMLELILANTARAFQIEMEDSP